MEARKSPLSTKQPLDTVFIDGAVDHQHIGL